MFVLRITFGLGSAMTFTSAFALTFDLGIGWTLAITLVSAFDWGFVMVFVSVSELTFDLGDSVGVGV